MTIVDSFVQINTKAKANQIVDQALDNIKKSFRRKDIDLLARETCFIKRSSSKIRGLDFLMSFLVASSCGTYSTLEGMTEILTRVNHKVTISAQALMKRINNKTAVYFLKTIYLKMLKEKLVKLSEIPAPLLACFTKVLLQDSSSITLHEKLQGEFKGSGGRASKASAKFDVIYDWKAKNYEQIVLTDQGEADQKLGLQIEAVLTEGSLVIRDLGYLRVDGLIKIIAKKAFFLSRLRSSILVYLNQDDKDPTDIADYIAKKYKSLKPLDLQVFITAEKLAVRLVVYKAPKDVANKRRREAKATAKKQGRQLQEKTLKFMDYTMFITNVSIEIWEPEVIGTIYRIRWQIELIFKCWKSKAHIHYIKGIKHERIRCLIYAKLIVILLINQIYKLVELIGHNFLERMVSMFKVFAWAQDADRLIRLTKGSVERWEKRCFIQTVSKSMCMQKRNRKTTLESICEGEFYYYQAS